MLDVRRGVGGGGGYEYLRAFQLRLEIFFSRGKHSTTSPVNDDVVVSGKRYF